MQILVIIATVALRYVGAQDSEWCDFNGGGTSACEWTEDCTVPGCAQKCQVDPTLGSLDSELNDRAFDTDWWQLCPQLARIVRNYKDIILDFTPTAPAPTSDSTDYGTEYGTDEYADSTETEGSARKLLQTKQYWNLTCPTLSDIDLTSSRLIGVGLDVENVLVAKKEGRPLTAEETGLDGVEAQQNKWWTVLPFILEPAKLADYMEANCSNRDLGGPTRAGRRSQDHFWEYHGDWGTDDGHLDINETFGMCVDNFGGYEAFARGEEIKDAACHPPFDVAPTCFDKIYAIDHWPTTAQCADELAKLYGVDAEHLRDIRDVILDAKTECASKTTKEECADVPRLPYENNVSAIIEEIPFRALGNITISSSGTPDATSSSPTASDDTSSVGGDTLGVGDGSRDNQEEYFPGLKSTQTGANEEDVVTAEDLETSDAWKTLSNTLCCSLVSFWLLVVALLVNVKW